MKSKKVLVLPGDGIGREVCHAALPVLDALEVPIELSFGDIGWECWKKEGNTVPGATWDKIRQVDAILLGAITSKGKKQAEMELPDHLRGTNHKFVSPVIQLRQKLELYANVRPSYFIKGNGKPYNLCVIRENTEGLYAGLDYKGIPEFLMPLIQHSNIDKYGYDETAFTIRLLTKHGLKRLFEFAFDYATKHDFYKVTFADKPNVMRESGAFAQEILNDVALNFPDIEFDIQNVDAVALWLATKPEKFGVIVAENMFGDILSDLAGGIMGGLGLAPSANYGIRTAYFEPVHGSAPGMYGKNKANPSAMLLSISLMLDYLGFDESAAKLKNAVQEVVRKSDDLTYDFGGDTSTDEFANKIIEAVKENVYKKNAAIITVGDELLGGEYHNSNLKEISCYLNNIGYNIKEHTVCGDQKNAISQSITRYLGDHELLIVCGGLGPTSDDITRFAVADVLDAPLEFSDYCWQHIYDRMKSFNLPVKEIDKVQAYIPVGAEIIRNNCGMASGFKLSKNGTTVVVLPGPPKEMKEVLETEFSKEMPFNNAKSKHTWKLLGLTETEANIIIDKVSPCFSETAKYIWRYPYLNVTLEVEENDVSAQNHIDEVNRLFLKYTVSTNGLSASELLEPNANVCWSSDDDELNKHLKLLPGSLTGDSFIIKTTPKLSSILNNQVYKGSLDISCHSYNGNKYNISTPLVSPEIIEYIKEFSCWCYIKNSIKKK